MQVYKPKTFFCGAWQAVLIVDNLSVKCVWLVKVLASLGDTYESLCLQITKTLFGGWSSSLMIPNASSSGYCHL